MNTSHTSILWNPVNAWRHFRLEAKAAQNYPLPYSMYIGQTHRDTLLEKILPTLLYVKAVAILDDALELWLKVNNRKLVAPYRDDLNGRLEYLNDKGLISNASQLHEVRKLRNTIAHEPGTSCDWAKLEGDISLIETCLVSLELARQTPKLEYVCERSAMEASVEPGVNFSRTFSYGVKENGKLAFEVSWTQKFLADKGAYSG